MRCASCARTNDKDAKFCADCGAPLTASVRCPSCAAANRVGQRFCGECGSPIEEGGTGPDARGAASPPKHIAAQLRAARGTLEGERKQVTVLFVDVKGSMDLSEAIDAEQWWAVMDRFFEILCDGVHRFEGRVQSFTGDGVMAVFGAPLAYEDHARRAAHAALHLNVELACYARSLAEEQGVEFAVRTGINSGEVVVGTIGDDLTVEYAAIGHTAGLAQRMEGLAEPGNVFVSEHTAKLIGGYFELADRGSFEVKGASAPLRVFELIGAGAFQTSLDVSHERGFSRFVGRGQELDLLESSLEQARAGAAQVVGLAGEPGIGKSRLRHEFVESCRRHEVEVWQAYALSHTSAVPFVLVLELLRAYFGIVEADDSLRTRQRIEERLVELDASFNDALPLLFEFLGVPDPERPAPRIDPEARQRQLFTTLTRLVVARSRLAPAVIALEDLQWIDAGSEAFLENLIDGLEGTRTLLLVTFRPEYSAPWLDRDHFTRLDVRPLDRTAADVLLADLAGSDRSIDGLADLLRERTGGNPFFIEEIIKALSESGDLEGSAGAYRLTRTIDQIVIPGSVESVLAARIDRLEESEKRVLQTAAVIGRRFAEPVLRHIVGFEGDRLKAALQQLVAAELISLQSSETEGEYLFRHALTAQVAYRSQLSRNRRGVHAAVAQAMVELYPEFLDEQAALIAHHWREGGDPLQAAQWTARAAGWAGFNDPFEAARRWRDVQSLAEAAPPSNARVEIALTACMMRLTLAWRLGVAEGQTPAQFEQEIAQIYDAGRKLADESENLFSQAILAGVYATLRELNGHSDEELAMRSLALARETGDHALQLTVIPAPLYMLYQQGRYTEMIALADEMIALAGGDATLGGGPGLLSPYAWMLMWRGVAHAFTGRLEESSSGLQRALATAHEQGDQEIECWCRVLMGSVVADLAGEDPDSSLAQTRLGVELANRTGGAYAHVTSYWSLGISHLLTKEWPAAIVALEKSLAIARHRRVGFELEPATLGYLALARLGDGQPGGAREASTRALELSLERGTKGWELLARLALVRALRACDGAGAVAAIDAELRAALQLVNQTGARGLEPRVHLELAELARLRGDESACRHALEVARRQLSELGRLSVVEAVPSRGAPSAVQAQPDQA